MGWNHQPDIVQEADVYYKDVTIKGKYTSYIFGNRILRTSHFECCNPLSKKLQSQSQMMFYIFKKQYVR